ncbi:MAG: hypothetical protein ACLURV_08125 [Gallintestinimicrobium sp.]
MKTARGLPLALIDESYMKVLYTAWADFAYANEPALLGKLRYASGAAGALILFCGKKGCLIFCLTRMEIIPCQTII